jgi:hypothetical protein
MPKPDTFSVKKYLKALSGITCALIQQALANEISAGSGITPTRLDPNRSIKQKAPPRAAKDKLFCIFNF